MRERRRDRSCRHTSVGQIVEGDKVWADGVLTGCLLIHRSIIQVLWDESPEYTYAGDKLCEVFVAPRKIMVDDTGGWHTMTGTSDLEFCGRIIAEDVLKRAGWPKIARKRFPYLVDTKI